jgi:protein SCO1/2
MKIRTMLNIGVASTFFVVVAAATLMAFRGNAVAIGGRELPVLGSVPDFALTEANGSALKKADLIGKVWIASFIFTRCAEQCPAMMRHEVELQAQLPVRDDLRLVSFSVDPDWDTPKVLTGYANMFKADRQRWFFTTGDKRQIFSLAIDGFKLSTQEADTAREMPILHSTKLVLVDRRGLIRGYYDSTEAGALRQLVRDTVRLLAERS